LRYTVVYGKFVLNLTILRVPNVHSKFCVNLTQDKYVRK